MGSASEFVNGSLSQRIFPDSLSKQTAYIRVPSGVAVVTQTWLSQTTGEDHARPCIAVFHLTFWDSLQVRGRPMDIECPFPRGPRNSGQAPGGEEIGRA